MKKIIPALLVTAVALSGCGAVGRLKQVGKVPTLTEAEPLEAPYMERSLGQSGGSQRREAITPSAAAAVAAAPTASLFRAGAGAFLGDQRASRVGDILTIRINIADKAAVDNTTTRTRTGSENSSITSLLGLQKLLPGRGANLASTSSDSENKGGGNISRSETINMLMTPIAVAGCAVDDFWIDCLPGLPPRTALQSPGQSQQMRG